MTPHNLINVDEGRLTATRGPGTGDTFMSVRTSHAFRKGADGKKITKQTKNT